MAGSSSASAAARVKDEERRSHQQAQSKGKGKKKKGKGKGKGKANENGGGKKKTTNLTHLLLSTERSQRRKDRRSQYQGGGPGPSQNTRSRGGGHVHAGQKRNAATANETGDDIIHLRSSKRLKNERPSGPVQPHPDFWHIDGSVVVEIGNTKFKLHRSMLQKHSLYFTSLFQKTGVPSQGGRAYLEVEVDERNPNAHIPVYRVSETTADDFAALLTVIEEPMKYADEAPPMPILAGVLRAARALSFDAQCKWAERVFRRMWPATLDAVTNKAIPHASIALALARTCGIHSVRKRASYELLRVPALGQSIAAPAEDGAGADALPREDMLRLLHAREQLCLFWAEAVGKAPTEFPCLRGAESDRGPCAMMSGDRVHSRWAELVHASGVFAQRMIDPLMGLQDLADMPWRDEGFCKKCVAARVNEWAELKRKLWDNLEVWLELTAE